MILLRGKKTRKIGKGHWKQKLAIGKVSRGGVQMRNAKGPPKKEGMARW